VAPRAESVPTGKLIRQEQFLYSPVLLCIYLTLLQIIFLNKVDGVHNNYRALRVWLLS
jgi:hypothetical protein